MPADANLYTRKEEITGIHTDDYIKKMIKWAISTIENIALSFFSISYIHKTILLIESIKRLKHHKVR